MDTLLWELEPLFSHDTHTPFITGSRCYGHPRPDSDLDLVVNIDGEHHDRFWKLIGDRQKREKDAYGNSQGMVCLRLGMINLLCCLNLGWWYSWSKGTKRLMREAPVTRQRAIEVFDQERKRVGIPTKADEKAGIGVAYEPKKEVTVAAS